MLMGGQAGSRVINHIAVQPSSGLVAAAEFDPHVRVYDARARDGNVVKCTLTSHRMPVMAVAWSPSNSNLVGGRACWSR